jgi:hypothetical protein
MIFEVVGQPLVENCLQGFNSSIFAYGQVSDIFSFDYYWHCDTYLLKHVHKIHIEDLYISVSLSICSFDSYVFGKNIKL